LVTVVSRRILQNTYLSSVALANQTESWKNRALGAICFADTALSLGTSSTLPTIRIDAPVLSGEQTACEVWLSQEEVREGCRDGLRYRCDGHQLFGVIELQEPVEAAQARPLQQATEDAYRQIFALLDALDYPCLHRCWNYMAGINTVSHGLERYQQFNLGRQNAFIAAGRAVNGQVPAACALGLEQGPLRIAFIAGRTPALAIENPRQISAYEYPLQYGPSSPTFSRANLLRLGQSGLMPSLLLISGTASIVGHRTLHAGDVVAQTRETLSNIEAIVSEANGLLPQPAFNLAHILYRL
jgi:chorismate lyase/3-hydroxybenzoate synthase